MPTPNGASEIALGLFGGNQLEMAPTDIPQGLSWGSSNVCFRPGSFDIRPPLKRCFTLADPTVQIVYEHDYIMPTGTIQRITFDANGIIYADGVQIGTAQAGCRMQAHNAFGKCWMAFSDGNAGIDRPLKWNGKVLTRVSQDGPGGPSTFTPSQITADSYMIATITQGQQFSQGSSYFLRSPGPGVRGAGNRVTFYYWDINFAGSNSPDQQALQAALNTGLPLYVYLTFQAGGFTYGPYIALVDTLGQGSPPGQPHQFYYFSFYDPSGVTADTYYAGSGNPGYTATFQITQATVTTTAPVPNVVVGDNVVIADTSATGYNSTWPVIATPQSGSLAITQTALTGGVATYTFNVSTGVAPVAGQQITITNTLNANGMLNVTNAVIASVSGNTFTIGGFSTARDYPTSQENGTGTTAGSVFVIDPGARGYVVPQTVSPTSPIYGNSNGGTLTYDDPSTSAEVASGNRQGVVIFQTIDGFLTRPSPITAFAVAENTNAITVSDLPIGPPNVVARIVAFTAANQGKFFYLAQKPTLNGKTYGTSTIVDDNTTTSATFNFTDVSLLAGTPIDDPGNNLFNLKTLGPVIGFASYKGRLDAWGEWDKIEQFYNMGFEGGVSAQNPTIPLGWTLGQQGGGGQLVPGDYGMGWQITGGGSGVDGVIQQNAYQDDEGVPIIQPLTDYIARMWVKGSGRATVYLNSSSQGIISQASIVAPNAPGWVQAKFSLTTPAVIPSDLQLWVFGQGLTAGQTLIVDEIEIIYAQNPYNLAASTSYANNPESFDQVTGVKGIADDPNPIRNIFQRRDVQYLQTLDPNGALYETSDTQSGEPVAWDRTRKSILCGALSVWGHAAFEDFDIWVSATGLMCFDGGSVVKVSQEVQTFFDSINSAANQLTVCANDPFVRRIYILAATGTATVQNSCQVLDYRELNTAGLFETSGTLHLGGASGKVITTDLTRKWTTWTVTANYCAMVTTNGVLSMTFCGGTGGSLTDAAHGSSYTLAEGALTGIDDDYGPFWDSFFYPTYFFTSSEDAQQRQQTIHRLYHQFGTITCAGNGYVYLEAHVNGPGNIKRYAPGGITRSGAYAAPVALSPEIQTDIEFAMDYSAERISYGIRIQPSFQLPADPNTPCGISVSSMTIAVRSELFTPIRGRNFNG